MPTISIFHEGGFDTPFTELDQQISEALVEGLPAKGKIPQVSFIPSPHVGIGHVYAEVNCRNHPDRTPARMTALAQRLHAVVDAARTPTERGAFRVRIILHDDDHVFGFD